MPGRQNQATLIMFVDALGYDYLAERPLLPGFWQAELPIETLLGYSSSIVPSLWSGLYPEQMNAWNEFYYRPRRPYYLMHVLDKIPQADVRNLLRRIVCRIPRLEWYRQATERTLPGIPIQIGKRQFWLPHLPLGWHRESMPGVPAVVEHLFSRATGNSSCFPPIPLGEAGLDERLRRVGIEYRYWFSSHKFSATQALANIRAAADSANVFIYGTAHIDDAGHIYGPHPHLFDAQLAEVEKFIAGATTLLTRREEPIVVILSDHGMTPVTRRFDLIAWLRPWKLGRDYLAFLDSTMARFWDKGQVPLERVTARVSQAGIGRFLTQADKDHYGLNFSDNRFGDQILLLDSGCIISPSFMDVPYVPLAHTPVKGMHGFAPEDPTTRAVFLYHGTMPLPGAPVRVTDVAGVLERLMIRQTQAVAQ